MRNFTRFLGLVLLTALFYHPCAAQSYVQVGVGNEQSNQPFYTAWKYSYTSIIYTKAELGTAKTITGIGFNNNFTDLVSQGFDFDMPNQKLWIKHVPQEEWTFTSGQAPYEDPTANGYTLVWSGTFHYGAMGWTAVTFTTPFEYNGTDNIAIHWENGSGVSTYYLKTAASIVGKKQVKSGGSDVLVPITPGYESYPFGNKVNARFFYDAGNVPANPELTSPANGLIKTDLNSTLKFTLGTNTTSYDLYFGTDQANLTKVSDNVAVSQAGEVIYTPAALLQPNTSYYWKVVAKNVTATTESNVFSFKTQEVIAQFPYLQDFEAYWISNIDPKHPDTLNAIIDTNYPEKTPWGWDANWSASKGKTNAYQGLFSAYISAYSDGQYSLVTPRLNLPANMRVSFWWKNGYTAPASRIADADTTYFEVSSDGKATWKTMLKLCGPADMKTYDNVTTGLSEFASNNVYMRWRYRKFNSSAKQFFVDNIKVEAKPTGAIVTLDYSELTFPSIATSGKTKKRVIIYNTGISDLVVNGITTDGPYTCDFNKTIAPNAKDTAYIYFAPTSVGSFDKTVTFNVGGATGTTSVLCHGSAIARLDKFFQNFDAVKAIPADWVAIQSSKSSNIVQNIFAVSYVSDVYSAPNAMKMVRINDSDTLDPVILVSPGVTGFADNKLSFYARKGDVSYGLELIVGVMDDPNDASTFVAKQTVTLTEKYAQYTVKFKSNTTQPYIAFKYGEWTPKKPFPYTSIRLEDISWEADLATPPAAAQIGAPVDVAVNVDIMSGLKIRWAAGSANTDGYKLYVGTTTACNELIDAQDVSKDQPNYTLGFDKLAYNTKYYWKVVPYNENGSCTEPATWSFTTMSDPLVTAYPFNENFDNTPNIVGEFDKPLGWNIQDVFADKATWDMVTYPPASQGFTHNDSKGCIAIAFHPFNAKNDWLYTPPMQMKKGYSYDLECYIHTMMDYTTGSFYKEELSVWAGNGRINSAMTDSLAYEIVNDNDWKKVTTSFKPTEDRVYYLGFHAISKANQYVLIIDDVTIAEKNITGVDTPEAEKSLKVYPNPATDYVNFELPSSITGSAQVTVIDVLGKVVRKENLGESRVINLSQLRNGAYLLRVDAGGKSYTRKVFIKK